MLKIRTQGVLGKDVSNFKEVGFIEVNPDYSDNRIMIDEFEGNGSDYRRRESAKIIIRQGNKDYFEGTFIELLTKLSKHGV